MAEPWAEYIVSTPAQFWDELEEILSVPPKATLEQIDLALKTFAYFGSKYYHEYLSHDRALDHAIQMLLESRFYDTHSDRMVNTVMELIETRNRNDPIESTTKLHILLHILLQNGRQRPHVFKLLRQARVSSTQEHARPFIKLLIEILNRTEEEAHASGSDSSVEGLNGLEATDLLYEILRVKRLSKEELPLFEESFISHLFEIIEETRNGDEQYNYTLIRLIIALNEQFMVAGIEEAATGQEHRHKKSHSSETPNLVLNILKTKLGESKTFGENLIFILNRLNSSSDLTSAEDLCVSLLILKILYLLFSTASTSEYFYTNDLRVLVDVFIRELLDLPDESEGLRHTYLRVLHPLMANTQLRAYPYKRLAIRATLLCLLSDEHIRTITPTTRRLVERNLKADWCTALSPPPEDGKEVEAEAKLAKEMSALALKGPAMELRVEEARNGSAAHSTLSVHAVADANVPAPASPKSSHGSSKGHHHLHPVEHRVGHSLEHGHTLHGKNYETVHIPHKHHHHHHHDSARSSRESSVSLSASVESLPPRRVPPPRPIRTTKGTQSLPSTPPDTSAEDSQPSETGIRARFRRAPPPTPSRARKAELQQNVE